MPRRYYQPCSVPGCERMLHSHGLCRSHANRLRLYGDPQAGQRRQRAPNGAPEAFLEMALASDTDDCILWPYSFQKADGYPQIGRRGAHIVVCERTHGLRPGLLQACHSCGHGLAGCINPRHIRWDTASANAIERERHRDARGQPHRLAKLDLRSVEEIRWSYAHGLATQQVLAEIYGVSQNAISRIVRGKTWRLKV